MSHFLICWRNDRDGVHEAWYCNRRHRVFARGGSRHRILHIVGVVMGALIEWEPWAASQKVLSARARGFVDYGVSVFQRVPSREAYSGCVLGHFREAIL